MFDNNSSMMDRGLRPDQYAQVAREYAGVDRALTLRNLAVLAIASRLFLIYASANRISVTHALLGLVGADGQIDLTGQPDALGVVARARDADGLVTFALVATVVVMILFLLTSVSLVRRKKRGDTLAAAIDDNRAIRFASRLYLLASIGSATIRNLFSTGANASVTDRLDTVSHVDAANIGLQIVVIAFLLIVALATAREIRSSARDRSAG